MTANRDDKFFYGYVIVLIATLLMAVTWGTFYSFGVFFKPILAEFGWTRAATSIGYSLGFMISGLFAIFAGRLSDRFGPRIVVTICGLLIAAGYLLTSQVTAIWQLYLFYGIVGIGSSGAYVPSISAVSRWFVRRRGLMTGIAMAGIGLGTTIMSPLANWLIANYGWRVSYVIVGIVVLVSITLMAQFLKRDPAQMGMQPYGAGIMAAPSLHSESRGVSLLKAIGSKQFWMLCAMFAFVEYSVHNINVHIVPHTTDLAISSVSAANILAIIGAMSITSRVVMGAVGDRISNKPAAIACFVTMFTALIWLLFSQELWQFYLFAAIFGFAYG
ncbi:MFS transporter, partial [Chloroflexota bacterium]